MIVHSMLIVPLPALNCNKPQPAYMFNCFRFSVYIGKNAMKEINPPLTEIK